MTTLADIGTDLALPSSPARFANNLKIATMAAVKLELGSKAGVDITNINAVGAIQLNSFAMFGKLNLLGCASDTTAQLFSASNVIDGTSITLVNVNASGGALINVYAAGAQTIRVGTSVLTFAPLRPGDVMELTAYNGNWHVTGGTCAAGLATNFGFLTNGTSPGYQKLPNGTIFQWGQTGSIASGGAAAQTYPIAFPTAALIICATVVGGTPAATPYSGGPVAIVLSGFTLNNLSSGAASFMWFAIGK